jgi:AMP phosphorylase
MKLKVKILKFLTGRPVCMIHEKKAQEMSLHIDNRIMVKKSNKRIISIVNTISEIIKPNEIAVSNTVIKRLRLKKGDIVDVEITEPPKSINLIKRKLEGEELNKKEINEIVQDISNNALREAEIAFFISALNSKGMSLNETKNLIQAMVKTGKHFKLRGKVVDKHCIGGIAGNKTTPIIVSICAAAGLTMPKTSSRAITSATGTVDVIETIAKVDFSIKEIKKLIQKTNACFVWGGALGLAPVDDKIIKVEKIVKIDSTAQLLASILSKKISVDSNYILIDIPYGKSAKVNKFEAEKLKCKFLNLGKKFDLKLEVVLTDGREPVGNAIGPVLEIQDIIKILKNEPIAEDLKEKSIMLSGRLLEMSGKAKKGKGEIVAREILESGKAFKKFEQIIKAQKGKIRKLNPGKYTHTIYSKSNKKIKSYDNKLINELAKFAGCPQDKSAGIYLYKKANQQIKKGDKIFTIYSSSKEKLNHAVKFYNKNKKMLVEF